jgi:F0F1-type ATP synthase assembly protein I
MEWLKETVNLKGYKRYEPPKQVVYDPWEIRMKSPELGLVIDIFAIINAVCAIIAFIIKQLTQHVDFDIAEKAEVVKEDEFMSGSLASALPKLYTVTKTEATKKQNKSQLYLKNTLKNGMQMKNLVIIILTCIGLVY